MDKRDFVLGLGIGIIFSVIVIWIVYGVSDIGSSELTKEEIEQKAKELGMEYVSDEFFLEMTESSSETESSSLDKYESETSLIVTYDNFEDFSMSHESMTEVLNNEPESADLTLNSTEKASEGMSESVSENTSEIQNNFIDVKINSGSNAKKVSRILADKGLIDNPEEYEKYLINNKKTKNIRTGNYKIPKGIDFDTLTDILTKVPRN